MIKCMALLVHIRVSVRVVSRGVFLQYLPAVYVFVVIHLFPGKLSNVNCLYHVKNSWEISRYRSYQITLIISMWSRSIVINYGSQNEVTCIHITYNYIWYTFVGHNRRAVAITRLGEAVASPFSGRFLLCVLIVQYFCNIFINADKYLTIYIIYHISKHIRYLF